MTRSHIYGSLRLFHYGSNPTDDPGNDNFHSPIRMHNLRTTTYEYGCNTEIYGLIRIATDDAGSYPWQILHQTCECVTWALRTGFGLGCATSWSLLMLFFLHAVPVPGDNITPPLYKSRKSCESLLQAEWQQIISFSFYAAKYFQL